MCFGLYREASGWATLQYHVRFFPQKNGGDKNAIVLPAPLVETDVTQPYENDFYWCACLATNISLEVGQTPSFTTLIWGIEAELESLLGFFHKDKQEI